MTDTAAKTRPTPKAAVASAAPATEVVANKVEAPAATASTPVQSPAATTLTKPVAAAPVAKKAESRGAIIAAPTTKPTPAAPRPAVKPVAKKPALRAAPVATPKRPAAKLATTAKEPKMVENLKTVTDKTQAYFTDANERAKGALEKSVKAFEEANAFQKGNIEALVESSKIAAKGAEKLGQDAAAYAKSSYEKANEAFRAMSSVKSPTDLFKLQSDFVRASFDAFVAETSRSTEAALKLAGEIAQPLSNRFALAAEKVKAAA
ncbi:TIGR01841 family phasin [Sphingomonas sp. TX0543]|uniref:phasin family protein n=1 Tax=unclassified Sphingomonas TaxID=196159 RepID=UPI0010F72303|nr:phasin family protein [Sphingomonas sp. 3P27F8]